MISKEKTKQFFQLDHRNTVILREPATFESSHAGEDIVMKMIEDGLDALGESVGRVILHHIEVSYSLKRDQIPRKFNVFRRALRDIFGEGSLTIERMIIETIRQRTGISANEIETRTLPHIVEYLRVQRPLLQAP